MLRSDYHHLESIDSTQNFAKEHVDQFDPQALTVITCDEQTKGKGRFNRTWNSLKKKCLLTTYSFLIPNSKFPLSSLTLIIAHSICEVFQKLGLNTQIKWPNDLFVHDKKIAGILGEIEYKKEGHQVFLGFGINVNVDAENCKALDSKATSLLVETHKEWDLKTIQEAIETTFKRDLAIFLEKGFHPFKDAYERLSLFNHKTVTLHAGEQKVSGLYQGINDEGALLLKLDDGTIHPYHSGEIISWE